MAKQDKMINIEVHGFSVVIRTTGEMPSDEAMLRMKRTLDDLKHKEGGLYEDIHS